MVYSQTNISENKFVRTFTVDSDSSELVWHRDLKDRIVNVINGGGWKFQLENELPIDLVNGLIIKIDKEVYHRIIKGYDNLIIIIEEN